MTGGSYAANIRQRKREIKQMEEATGIAYADLQKNYSGGGNGSGGTATPGTAKTANRHFWQFRNIAGGQSAELMLYGDIAQYSWYKDDVT